jgi:predicted Zn-dependent protease
MFGRTLLQTGDIPGAIKELEASVELRFDDPQGHFHLARAYREAGRHAEAERERAHFVRLEREAKDSERTVGP